MTTATPDRLLGDARPLIDGDWLSSTTGETYEHIDPATGQANGIVHLAGADEADAAVAGALVAFEQWRNMSGDARRRVLQNMESLIEAHMDEFARITALELGHPLAAGAFLARVCASWFGYYAGWADKIEGATIPLTPSYNVGFDYTLREPYGVIGAIITWNGPLASVGMKVAPALAAGNCVVLKTPELAPYACARLGELALEAGLPPGVLQVLPGGPEAGDRLVRDRRVGKISFTGGLPTARRILDAAKESLKPVVLELGGKSANIIFPDANMDTAMAQAFRGSWGLAGQECAFPSRLLVHTDIYDEVIAHAAAIGTTLTPGDPLDPSTVLGPVISHGAADRIIEAISSACERGAGRLVAGGGRVPLDQLPAEMAGGYFLQPTVLADVDASSDLAQEEVFGPVLSVLSFSTEDEAVEIANSTDFGLAATVHTSDVARVHRLAPRLAAGSVRFNGGLALPPGAPFGGYKRSGVGREGGREGLDEFLQTKNVFIKL